MASRKTLGQKRQARTEEHADRQIIRTGDRHLDALEKVRRLLGDDGHVFLASEVPSLGFTARRKTGIPRLDYMLGGGLPMGGQVEFGAPYSTGKTSLSIRCCAEAQVNEPNDDILWVALEPHAPSWMRKIGLWVPFNEDMVVNPATNIEEPADPFAKASDTELFRMNELGIVDPYSFPPHLAKVYIMTGLKYGDAALDAVQEAVRANTFSIIVVDSLGVAKSEKWTDEKSTRDASDFDRSTKMVGDYTIRTAIGHNLRYDDTGEISGKGRHQNKTTVINLQHIYIKMNNQSFSPWAAFDIKGGEASKHMHLSINALLQGQLIYWPETGDQKQRVGHTVKMKNLKSKIGMPYRDGEIDFYTADTPDFRAGDFDVWADVVDLGVISNVLQRNGNHIRCGEEVLGQGIRQAANFLRENPEWYHYVYQASIDTLSK